MYDPEEDQLKQYVEDDEEHPPAEYFIISQKKVWECRNKRDDTKKEKCVDFLALESDYNPSCTNQLKQYASCDLTCNLCQCSTYDPESTAGLKGKANHCSGHGKCVGT